MEFQFIILQVTILILGRYWVKLYCKGKLRKIEIDDRILFYGDSLIFPKCKNIMTLWPMLFTKALMKL